MKQQGFTITGMSCAACAARIEKVTAELPGVKQVQVNLLTHSMKVVYDDSVLSEQTIINAVERAGYGAYSSSSTPSGTNNKEGYKNRFFFSLAFLIPMMLLHHFEPGSATLQLLLLLPILWLNRKFFISGIRSAANFAPNMDTLIALGASAGILYSILDIILFHSGHTYIDAAGMILTLITLGKWIESRATSQAGNAINKLKELLPQTATVIRSGERIIIPAEDVLVGDILIIPAGSRIPIDAIVTEGVSSIDESALTGESIPVLQEKGSRIFAGTINGNAELRAEACQLRENAVLIGIIHQVSEATASKAPISRVADRISAFFVPAVVIISLSTAAIWLICGASLSFALGCAIAVLVVSCPCALGLATPVAIAAGAGIGAEHGILFRDGATMENARRTSAVVLDKTGTLTTGQPVVLGVYPAQKVSKSALLQLACDIENNNSHPLAKAIREFTKFYTPQPITDLAYHAARGVTAMSGGQSCAAGNAELMHELGIQIPETTRSAPSGITPIYFAQGDSYIGCIHVADPIKAESIAAVSAMQARGLKVLVMSGDTPETVAAIAQQAGVTEFYAGVTPADKAAKVTELQSKGHIVAMVGDGINDAPALTVADVGIAIGAGTDVAIESAGIVLVRSELSDAVSALKLSRAVIRTIRQNLFWAFFYNILMIPLAAGLYYPLLGWQLSPAVAAAAMSLSSLFVVGNALRLRRKQFIISVVPSMNTITISVLGMMCPHCERHVSQALSAIPGVEEVKADHKSNTVTLTCSAPVNEALIAAAVQQAGYDFKGIV